MLTDFQNSFTDRLTGKFAINSGILMLWPNYQVTTLRFLYRYSSIRIVSSESESLRWQSLIIFGKWAFSVGTCCQILRMKMLKFKFLRQTHDSALAWHFCAKFCANRMGFTFHRYDLGHFATAGLNDIVFSYHLFTVESRPPGAMHLRQRGHDFVLAIVVKYDCNKRNFIARSLFCYV